MKQMTREQRMEALRRRLAVESDDLELEYARGIVGVAKSMGWTIDYIMNMGASQFKEVVDALVHFKEVEERVYRDARNSESKTFG